MSAIMIYFDTFSYQKLS